MELLWLGFVCLSVLCERCWVSKHKFFTHRATSPHLEPLRNCAFAHRDVPGTTGSVISHEWARGVSISHPLCSSCGSESRSLISSGCCLQAVVWGPRLPSDAFSLPSLLSTEFLHTDLVGTSTFCFFYRGCLPPCCWHSHSVPYHLDLCYYVIS